MSISTSSSTSASPNESWFIDLQVNGYAGVDFNAKEIRTEDFEKACRLLRQHRVEAILATFITDDVEARGDRARMVVEARAESPLVRDVVQGIHLEGPFFSRVPGFIGAHNPDYAIPANLDATKRLFDACEGLLKIMTLAPECDPGLESTRWLADQGVTVSAGHCDASLDQLKRAVDAGLSMFTHLGNGCPLHLHRHDNIIQRVLHLADHLTVGLIADGIHVPFFVLQNILSATGLERAFVVTDAISAAGQGPGKYVLQGEEVVVDESLATWVADKSHLVGSAMTMPSAVENLKKHLGLDDDAVTQLTRSTPARFMARG